MKSALPPVAFRHLATACDAAKATASKLQKTALLAAYLRTLGSPDVGMAARFLAAQPFAPSTSKALHLGGAIVVEAVRQIASLERHSLNQAFREHGEIGEAISAMWVDPPMEAEPLLLGEVQAAFDSIQDTGVQEAKRQHLVALLRRCTAREAVYLIKIILGDMRIGVSEGVLETALAEAFDTKLAAVRKARLLVGDIDAVALLACAGGLDLAKFRPFIPLGSMLAQPIMTAQEMIDTLAGRPAVAEDKYDGIRAQLHVAPPEGNPEVPPRVELFSRGAGAVSASFPDIVEPVTRFAAAIGRRFVLDGEIVPMQIVADADPITLPFSTLQKRLGRKTLTARQLRENPCVFVAFDLLWLDGALLLDRPLSERREKLQQLCALPSPHNAERRTPNAERPPPPFIVGPSATVTTAQELDVLFTAARARRNEGLVVKRLDSTYTPGRRGDAWLKLKSHLPTLDVVVVAAERGHGKRKDVLSDVTFAVRKTLDDPSNSGAFELATIGKAYSGLTDAEIADLTGRFMDETLEERGRQRIVRPTVVLEIAFDQITRSARHNSGFALRFPRIARIRDDKTLSDIDTLERVEQIFRSPDNLALELTGEPRAGRSSSPDQLSLF